MRQLFLDPENIDSLKKFVQDSLRTNQKSDILDYCCKFPQHIESIVSILLLSNSLCFDDLCLIMRHHKSYSPEWIEEVIDKIEEKEEKKIIWIFLAVSIYNASLSWAKKSLLNCRKGNPASAVENIFQAKKCSFEWALETAEQCRDHEEKQRCIDSINLIEIMNEFIRSRRISSNITW